MADQQDIPVNRTGDDAAGTDPLADLAGHLRAACAALMLRLSLLIDEAVTRVYDELFSAYLVAVWVLATVITTIVGGYYLVSGVAQGITILSGSPWIGNVVTGIIFLGLPVIVGYAFGIHLRNRRARRLARKYQALREAGGQP